MSAVPTDSPTSHSSPAGSRPASPPDSPVAKLRAQVGEAMKAGNRARTETLRMFLAEVNKMRIDSGAEPAEPAVVAVAEKMIKQRRESAELYVKAGRDELAQKENSEIVILQEFLPEQLPESELAEIVANAVANPGHQGNIGKIMAELKAKIAGRADMSQVARRVKDALKS